MIDNLIDTLTPAGAWTKGAYARTDQGRVIGPQCAPRRLLLH